MSVQKISCPECGVGLKSAAGFKVGQTVCCRKCETYFTVEEPVEDESLEEEDQPKPARAATKKAVKAAVADDEDEEEERPKKKKKKKREDEGDEEWSYKSSPLRFVVIGVLVAVMLVLAYFLYEKKKKERESADAKPVAAETDDPELPIVRPKIVPVPAPINNAKLPKGGRGPDVVAVAGSAVDGVFGGGPVAAGEVKKLIARYTTALVGAWTADLGNGTREQLVYSADGTFSATRTGPGAATASGKYTVKGLVGTKGLKLQLDGTLAQVVTAIFEDDELQHPSLEKGVTAVFRKK